MLSFREFRQLDEKIDSRELEREVHEFILDKVNFNGSVNRIKIDLKAGIRALLAKHINNKNIKIKARVVYGKATEAEFGVNLDRNTETVTSVDLSIVLSKDEFNSADLKNKLLILITHEMIHAIQRVRSNFMMSISRMKKNFSQSNLSRKEYYAEIDEIEAYASETAQQIRISAGKQRFSMDKVKAILSTKDGMEVASHLSRIFQIYKHYFYGSSNRSDQQVWKLFLKKVMQHI